MAMVRSTERISQPPAGVGVGYVFKYGYVWGPETGTYYDTAEAAYAAAVAAMATTTASGYSAGQGVGMDSGTWSATAEEFIYRIGGYSATGYLKVWYKLVTTANDGGDTPIPDVTTTGSVEIPFAGPITIPGNALALYPDEAGLSSGSIPFSAYTYGDEQTLGTQMPALATGSNSAGHIVTLSIVKWSALPGYEPPDDGSANGFPVAAPAS